MIQAQIFNTISQNADVIAIAGTKIYPIRFPPNADLPALVYTVNMVPVTNLDGDSGIDQCSVEIVSWAKDYITAHQLAYAARKALVEDSGLRIITESITDGEDLSTHSYSATNVYSVWSENNIGQSPAFVSSTPVYNFAQFEFDGDGATVDFTFLQDGNDVADVFRAGSLVIWNNGIVVKKSSYVEKVDRNGVIFNTAPEGGDVPDELLAFYALE